MSLYPLARGARQRRDDLIEDRVYNVLDIPLVKVRVVLGDTLNKFGFDHGSRLESPPKNGPGCDATEPNA